MERIEKALAVVIDIIQVEEMFSMYLDDCERTIAGNWPRTDDEKEIINNVWRAVAMARVAHDSCLMAFDATALLDGEEIIYDDDPLVGERDNDEDLLYSLEDVVDTIVSAAAEAKLAYNDIKKIVTDHAKEAGKPESGYESNINALINYLGGQFAFVVSRLVDAAYLCGKGISDIDAVEETLKSDD